MYGRERKTPKSSTSRKQSTSQKISCKKFANLRIYKNSKQLTNPNQLEKKQSEEFIFQPRQLSEEVRNRYRGLGKLEWHCVHPDDDFEDYGINLKGHVTYISKINLGAFYDEREERKKIKIYKGFEPSKPNKGHWFCVYDNSSIPNSDHDPCNICLNLGHSAGSCSYLRYVTKHATIGPGGVRVCKCCRTIGGHTGDTNWIACVEYSVCLKCRNIAQHETGACQRSYEKL
ncbi:hypothetical protein AQUCO_02100146v1 [Aquilegia coerulea]|uniref:Uncharacterized protein n=1 Tax=Aquilegia coerulea TaxID=218851 RepID=A0A2G5DF32_AQUCA|nr:hypothetical protein AQUCO_02100146v1 [Aquilegia coerulea]